MPSELVSRDLLSALTNFLIDELTQNTILADDIKKRVRFTTIFAYDVVDCCTRRSSVLGLRYA
jgi:hypothetical protein